nr:MAG TPA_asm: hypothetical protein [Caudoviricetes sp.]
MTYSLWRCFGKPELRALTREHSMPFRLNHSADSNDNASGLIQHS